MEDFDHMYMGDSTLLPLKDGWWLDTLTNNKISPDGIVYDQNNRPISKVEYLNEDDDTTA